MAIYFQDGKVVFVNGKVATAADCCCSDVVTEIWRYCSNDAYATAIASDYTPFDIAYKCSFFGWDNAMYNSGEITTNPPRAEILLEDCNSVDCIDLGWPLSDDFSGTGCNTGAVDDTPWKIKRMDVGEGSVSITGGELLLDSTAGIGIAMWRYNQISLDDTYDIILKYRLVDFVLQPSRTMKLELDVRSTNITYIDKIWDYFGTPNQRISSKVASGSVVTVNNTDTAGYFRVSRDASNNVTTFISTDGVNWTTMATGTDANNQTLIILELTNIGGTGASPKCYVDYTTVAYSLGGAPYKGSPFGISCI